MRFTGRIVSSDINLKNGKPRIVVELNEKGDFMRGFDEIKDEPTLRVELSKPKKKRSLEANAYAWVLLGRLSEKLRIPADEIYRNLIRDVGGNSEVVCVKTSAVEKLTRTWERNGVGWITDTMPSKLPGCTVVILYYGSSSYDTQQMNRLIELIIAECKENGVQTDTPEEIAFNMMRFGS